MAVAVLFFYLSCGGILLSLWAHVLSLFGLDPRTYFHWTWLVQLVLLMLLIPILVHILRRGLDGVRLFPVPHWQKRLLVGLIVYYTLHFYLFIWLASDHLESYMTWRMYSAGWLLLFTVCAMYYFVRARPYPDRK
ncbi:MAG: hypothetical protein WA324_26360 [Bryobacteraceae bacterium]